MTHPTTGFEDPRPGLRAAWLRLASEAGLIGAPDSVAGQADALLGRWSAPTRQYHDVRHLRSVLDSLAVLTAPGPTPVAVELAAWFHDAVYDGRPGADEEASAVLAERVLAELKAPAGLIAEVGRLIRLTIDHAVAEDDAGGEEDDDGAAAAANLRKRANQPGVGRCSGPNRWYSQGQSCLLATTASRRLCRCLRNILGACDINR